MKVREETSLCLAPTAHHPFISISMPCLFPSSHGMPCLCSCSLSFLSLILFSPSLITHHSFPNPFHFLGLMWVCEVMACPFSFLLFFFHLRVSERNEKTQEGKGEGREEKRGREATWLIPSSSLISISLFCFFYLSSLCHPARCSEGKGWHGKEKERCLSLPCPLSHGCPILIHETVSGERKGKDMPEWPKGTGSEWAVFLFSHLSHINRSHTIPSHCPCRLFRSSPFPRSWPPTWQRSEGSASETREAKGKSWPLPTLLSPTTRKEWNGRSWP